MLNNSRYFCLVDDIVSKIAAGTIVEEKQEGAAVPSDIIELLETYRKDLQRTPAAPASTLDTHRMGLIDLLQQPHCLHIKTCVDKHASMLLNTKLFKEDTIQLVLPNLYIGSYHPANNEALMRSMNITHIVCCVNCPPRFPSKFEYLVIPAEDNAKYDMSQHFEEAVKFMHTPLGVTNTGVLVHCGAGISRSAAIVIAYIMWRHRIPYNGALSIVQQSRSACNPNVGFQQQLKQWWK
eukprot:PhF_6_TR5086/c0_g1_i1/m.7135